jgi:APA family basic amino acid/polyamine antiporter
LPAAVLNIDEVVELTNIGTLFAFVIVCIGVMILRKRRPEVERKFKVPFVWVSAPLGIVFCGWLASSLPALTWLRFFLWLAVGMVIYVGYGARNSRLRAEAKS